MKKNHFVLSNMDQILDALTRGLDLDILTRGYGVESRGVMVSYQAQSPVLGLVLPSNSPGVHTLWLPVIPMQIGLVLKPGPQEPWTPYRMAAAFSEAGVPKEAIAIYPGGGDIGAEVVRRSNRTHDFRRHGDGRTLSRRSARAGPRTGLQQDSARRRRGGRLGEVHRHDGRQRLSQQRSRLHQLLRHLGLAPHARRSPRRWPSDSGPIEPKPPEDPQASLAAFTVPGAARAIWKSIEAKLDEGGSRTCHGEVRPASGREGALRLSAADGDSLRLARAQARQYGVHVPVRQRGASARRTRC